MQLLDADYFLNANKPVIRLYGKAENGNSVCVFYDKFLPYFYVKPNGRTAEGVKKIREIVSSEEVNKFTPLGYQTEPAKLLKITIANPQDVPKVSAALLEEKLADAVYENDIMFKYRFMVDNAIHGMDWIDVQCQRTSTSKVPSPVSAYAASSMRMHEKKENADLRYLAFDIECIPSDTTKPLNSKKDPIVMIAVAFKPAYKSHETLVLVAKPFQGRDVIGFQNEKEMLQEFLNIISIYDPDVLTGYNINSFDLPYLLDRLEQNGLSKFFGRCSDKPVFTKTFGISQDTIIHGRIVADPYQIIKRDPWVKFYRYNLNTVAKAMLNEEKMDVEYREMPGLWKGSREGLNKFIEYSRKDASISLRLVIEKKLLDKFFELAKISGLLLQDTFGGQSMRIETMILHEFRKRNFVMPSKTSSAEMSKREKEREKLGLKGATVLEPRKGLHADGCTLVLDFQSLYPSLMKAHNISPDSLVVSGNVKSHTAPTGSRFVDREVYEGIFPFVLSQLLQARDSVKKAMKTAKGDEKRILNAKQLAIKDISNSFYGYTGYSRARLYVIDVANSITAYGRENIEKTKKLVEENFPVEVVYGDSVTKDRFVTIMDRNGFISVKNIEELFEENQASAKVIEGKERIFISGCKALTVNPKTMEPRWSEINEIIRHKTNKKIYRVSQKFGETVVTEDHSLIVNDNGSLAEAKPTGLAGREIARVSSVPRVASLGRLDMYELLKGYSVTSVYKSREKTAVVRKDDDHVWFNWQNRKSPVKMKRFISTGTPEIESLCRLLGAYVSEGSSSTPETSVRDGASIASSDTQWLEQLQSDYELLFENTVSSIIESDTGVRELHYNTGQGNQIAVYKDNTHKLQMMNALAAVMFKVLCGQKSIGKRIPDFAFHLPNVYKTILLENMVKGDGSRKYRKRYSSDYQKKNFRYHTKSLALISGLSLLLAQLGMRYSIDYGVKKKCYRLSTCASFNSNTKTRITEEQYDGYVYDLSVTGSHMFVDSCGQMLLHNTDSLFLKTKITNLDEARKLGEAASKFVSAENQGKLNLQFEKIYRTFLILTKKRYAGWKFVFDNNEWKDEIEMKGIETIRRDWCPLVSETMRKVIDIILKEGDIQKSIASMRTVLESLKKNEVPLDKLTIVKGITKSPENYDGMLPHIELAKKLADRNPHDKPKIGDRLGFVIIRGNQMLSKRAEDPQYVSEHGLQIDSDYYINSQLLPPIERILISIGVTKGELLGSGHQTNIFDLMNGNKRKMKHEISLDYSIKTLEGWENVVCQKCSRSYRRHPLQGVCECGGELLIAYHGSVGRKIVRK